MARVVQSSSYKRQNLGEILPIDTPFSVHIFTSYFCDFKCAYCLQSLGDEEFKKIFHYKKFMDMRTFQNAIDGISQFPRNLKVLCFDGQGEPLLNPDLPDMIAYAKKKNIAERIELVTNGNRLSRELSEKLVEAGLDRIRISIQGLNAGKYLEISGVHLDFEKFRDNLKYLYEHRKQLSVYIKIVDAALDGVPESVFYDMFGKMCDDIAVEHVVPTAEKVDYTKIKQNYDIGQQGYKAEKIKACPFPFYMLIIEPQGEVRACCATRHPVYYGNVNEAPVAQLWGNEQMRTFWAQQLSEAGRYGIDVCSKCLNPDFGVQQGDNIDMYTQAILNRLENMHES